ncbi:hypothetical protein D9758_008275 [Tetrapyrgos nigripes]|uniref:Uncharacterized protein n=1 Tax=Tetrapyrgos nigripes TaxID=182062 RepID=A0A8H5LF94_9AGAR|nr:hypothetical protein D9758_008275 [Tetrapyrgos nigripes]
MVSESRLHSGTSLTFVRFFQSPPNLAAWRRFGSAYSHRIRRISLQFNYLETELRLLHSIAVTQPQSCVLFPRLLWLELEDHPPSSLLPNGDTLAIFMRDTVKAFRLYWTTAGCTTNLSCTYIFEAISDRMPQLTSVSLLSLDAYSNNILPDAMASMCEHLPALAELKLPILRYNQFMNIITAISHYCPLLEILEPQCLLPSTQPYNYQQASLPLPSLKRIHLDVAWDIGFIRFFEHCPMESLQVCHLLCWEEDDEVGPSLQLSSPSDLQQLLTSITSLPQISKLSLSLRVDFHVFQPVLRCSNLRSLSFDQMSMTEADFVSVGRGLPYLESLKIGYLETRMNLRGLIDFAKHAVNLQHLELPFSPMYPGVANSEEAMKQLKLDMLKGFRKLRSLHLNASFLFGKWTRVVTLVLDRVLPKSCEVHVPSMTETLRQSLELPEAIVESDEEWRRVDSVIDCKVCIT